MLLLLSKSVQFIGLRWFGGSWVWSAERGLLASSHVWDLPTQSTPLVKLWCWSSSRWVIFQGNCVYETESALELLDLTHSRLCSFCETSAAGVSCCYHQQHASEPDFLHKCAASTKFWKECVKNLLTTAVIAETVGVTSIHALVVNVLLHLTL